MLFQKITSFYSPLKSKCLSQSDVSQNSDEEIQKLESMKEPAVVDSSMYTLYPSIDSQFETKKYYNDTLTKLKNDKIDWRISRFKRFKKYLTRILPRPRSKNNINKINALPYSGNTLKVYSYTLPSSFKKTSQPSPQCVLKSSAPSIAEDVMFTLNYNSPILPGQLFGPYMTINNDNIDTNTFELYEIIENQKKKKKKRITSEYALDFNLEEGDFDTFFDITEENNSIDSNSFQNDNEKISSIISKFDIINYVENPICTNIKSESSSHNSQSFIKTPIEYVTSSKLIEFKDLSQESLFNSSIFPFESMGEKDGNMSSCLLINDESAIKDINDPISKINDDQNLEDKIDKKCEPFSFKKLFDIQLNHFLKEEELFQYSQINGQNPGLVKSCFVKKTCKDQNNKIITIFNIIHY